MVKTLGVIQARLSSTRLPAKIMLDLAGQPLLARVVTSVAKAKCFDQLVVATSNESSDDLTEMLCERIGIACYRGSLNNVLARFYNTAKQYDTDTVVRITADNPLTCPELIDSLYKKYLERSVDYIAYKDVPYGAGVEVFSFSALKEAYEKADGHAELEHVTPYIIKNKHSYHCQPEAFFNKPDIRVTVDTLDDYIHMSNFYNYVVRNNAPISLREHIAWMERND